MLVSACAGTRVNTEAPKITVSSLEPIELGSDQQVFRFALDTFNPNEFDLLVRGVDFVTRISGVEIARGFSENSVAIPANGNTTLEIDVTTDLARVVSDLKSLFTSSTLNLNYEMEGSLHLVGDSDGIPFNLSGDLFSRE